MLKLFYILKKVVQKFAYMEYYIYLCPRKTETDKTLYNMEVRAENRTKSATSKQLFALYLASGKTHDYRNDNLTREQASQMLSSMNESKVISVKSSRSEDKLEKEFLSYMSEKMEGIISIAKSAVKIKSIVEDDPTIFAKKKDRKQYAFFGFGCGITIIDFDKRSKIGKEIKELSSKHVNTTFLKQFLGGFSAKERKYFDSLGSPLSALYCQDIRISGAYEQAVSSFMIYKGVKNVRLRTFYD